MVNCDSLVVYWLLSKSENIGKKTNQSRLLNSFLFVQIETGAAAKNIEICHIAIENDLTASRFHTVASY